MSLKNKLLITLAILTVEAFLIVVVFVNKAHAFEWPFGDIKQEIATQSAPVVPCGQVQEQTNNLWSKIVKGWLK